MRIAHVLPVYEKAGIRLTGGAERYVLNLGRALSAYSQVTLVTFGPSEREEMLDGIRHLRLPGFACSRDNALPRTLFTRLRDVDLIHAFQLRAAATSYLALLRRALERPLVVTDLGGGGRSLMYRARLHDLVPHFISISEFSRSLLPERARPRAVVIPGGVDLACFPYSEAVRRPQALQVGRIMPHKGMNYLIEAAGDDLEVVILGKNPDPKYYHQLRELSRGKPVRFLVDPGDDELVAEYQRSTVTVAASVYRDLQGNAWPNSELLGMTLLESQAVGTPVICTDVGGMPEYVRDGETGFIVKPNDPAALREKIQALISDPVRARGMGVAANLHVQQYGWEAVARSVAAEYERILGIQGAGSLAEHALESSKSDHA